MYPGYFVLVYQWDHRCYTLMESIRKRFQTVSRELGELELQTARDTVTLLNFYKKWHRNKELYQRTITEIQKRQFVIDSLGYRGYGVNRDLYGALVSVKKEYAEGRIATSAEPEPLFSGHEENPVADKYRHFSEVILKCRHLIHDLDKGLYGISQPSFAQGFKTYRHEKPARHMPGNIFESPYLYPH